MWWPCSSLEGVTLESLSQEVAEGGTVKELPVLLKGDVAGLARGDPEGAVRDLPSDKIRANVLRSSIGADHPGRRSLLASASNAIDRRLQRPAGRATAELAKQEDRRDPSLHRDLRGLQSTRSSRRWSGCSSPTLREKRAGPGRGPAAVQGPEDRHRSPVAT